MIFYYHKRSFGEANSNFGCAGASLFDKLFKNHREEAPGDGKQEAAFAMEAAEQRAAEPFQSNFHPKLPCSLSAHGQQSQQRGHVLQLSHSVKQTREALYGNVLTIPLCVSITHVQQVVGEK